MENFKIVFKKSLFVLIPIAFFILIYLFGVLIKCEFDIRLWSEKERLLLVGEGVIAMIIGVLIASIFNHD